MEHDLHFNAFRLRESDVANFALETRPDIVSVKNVRVRDNAGDVSIDRRADQLSLEFLVVLVKDHLSRRFRTARCARHVERFFLEQRSNHCSIRIFHTTEFDNWIFRLR